MKEIHHDEMARRRIESLEYYLRLMYCATHNVHYQNDGNVGFLHCPEYRHSQDRCAISAFGKPQF